MCLMMMLPGAGLSGRNHRSVKLFYDGRVLAPVPALLNTGTPEEAIPCSVLWLIAPFLPQLWPGSGGGLPEVPTLRVGSVALSSLELPILKTNDILFSCLYRVYEDNTKYSVSVRL
ncbi:hypothetical protein AOXY_G20131 [Acipenser oxyrinchus oxyrinchus]|uniref:Uncharacterized protein n=1 Tax=Acipenser oxyrinchus oxyrinchus TaxID=40147 RepID=A0AAD8D231_ACIOX|nr:hypothetical protein AOXY_G20131 [Acipenser oxyrinchus oxyrinchus]